MKYVANPVEVDAFVIHSVQFVRDAPNASLVLDGGKVVYATPEMMSRMTPRPGDYWVVQSDGYEYLNPRAVFERKYSPKQEAVAAGT